MRRAIFWRPLHPWLMLALETNLFTWRSKGMLSTGKSLKPNNTSNILPITSRVFFHDLGAFSSSKINYQKWFIFAKTLPKTSVANEDKYCLFIPQRVRVRPSCISVDMPSYSERLHFRTTDKFLDEDLWYRFWYGTSRGRQSWRSWIKPNKFWYDWNDGWVIDVTLV